MFKTVLKVKKNASMQSIPSTLFSYNLTMCMFNSALVSSYHLGYLAKST